MAIWTQRKGILNRIFPTLCQHHLMVYLQERGIILFSKKRSWQSAFFTVPLGTRQDLCHNIWISSEGR
jgi:hypothetical protein